MLFIGRRKSIVALFCLLIFCLLHTSCGYRLPDKLNPSPIAGKRLAIPVFSNRSYRPNLEVVLTDKVKQELAFRTGGEVVRLSDADLTVSGTVSSYAVKPVAFDRTDKITRYAAELSAEFILRDSGGKVVWKGDLSDRQEFSTDADISIQLNRENAAVEDICSRIAQRLDVAIRDDF